MREFQEDTETQETDELCERCSAIDFNALFKGSIKMYALGTLKPICRNSTCPMCQLVVEAIKDHWNMSLDDIFDSMKW